MPTNTRVVTLLALAAPIAFAQAKATQPAAATPPPPPPPSPAEQTIQDIKHPVDWMAWGGDFRVRDEYFDSVLTLDPTIVCTCSIISGSGGESGRA